MPEETRKWAGFASRTEKRAALNLGIVQVGAMNKKLYRRDILNHYDRYYESTQYNHLTPWDDAAKQACSDGTHIPVRERVPRINVAFAKMLCSRLASKLVGERTFPKIKVENDPDSEMFFKLVLKMARLQAHLLEPIRRCLNSGSSFVRFKVVDGSLKIEHYLSKYCYPEFLPNGELESIRIQYVYDDPLARDEKGKSVRKWYRLDLGQAVDTLYDNPTYSDAGDEPIFTVVESVPHDLGYVQGQWFRTSEDKHVPDGYSLIADALDFIDEINYNLSQSSQAISYNQEPQLTLKGMDVDEVDQLIRSSQKAWHLGRDGEATFLETAMEGVQTASELRDKMRLGIQDIARVIMLDPEKMIGQAQSGKAMEILHGPMVELIEELRPMFEEQLQTLILKIALTLLRLMQAGVDVGLIVPKGFVPGTLDFEFIWPPIFPMTMQDLQQKLAVASAATSASIISRETATRWVADDFGVTDIEEEIAKVAAQPIINPFGGF